MKWQKFHDPETGLLWMEPIPEPKEPVQDKDPSKDPEYQKLVSDIDQLIADMKALRGR